MSEPTVTEGGGIGIGKALWRHVGGVMEAVPWKAVHLETSEKCISG